MELHTGDSQRSHRSADLHRRQGSLDGRRASLESLDLLKQKGFELHIAVVEIWQYGLHEAEILLGDRPFRSAGEHILQVFVTSIFLSWPARAAVHATVETDESGTACLLCARSSIPALYQISTWMTSIAVREDESGRAPDPKDVLPSHS